MDKRAGLRNFVLAVMAGLMVGAIQSSPLMSTRWFLPVVVFALVLAYLMVGAGGKQADPARVTVIRVEGVGDAAFFAMYVVLIALVMFGDEIISLLEKMVEQ